MRALALGLIVVSGCGGLESVDLDAGSGDASSVCNFVDAGNCQTARHSLACDDGHGCLTDEDVCSDMDAGCVNECDAGELAAWCGGPMQSSAPPAANCRIVGPLPSGTVIYCCPCGE